MNMIELPICCLLYCCLSENAEQFSILRCSWLLVSSSVHYWNSLSSSRLWPSGCDWLLCDLSHGGWLFSRSYDNFSLRYNRLQRDSANFGCWQVGLLGFFSSERIRESKHIWMCKSRTDSIAH